MWALIEYAHDNGGFFPKGEETPEASLSHLYPKYADANLLRGKSVPLEIVEDILKEGRQARLNDMWMALCRGLVCS
jgi:hypothetical protein